ncbi:MAG TPA: hypothetical protein VD902_14540 [Symbiobacteriaceae bacterium]|nr:hypothetical protein [Symbiobacteriaceae bacterium]
MDRQSVPRQVFDDPVVQLAALCPICALAALSPAAALSALSPTLGLFNPAINPRAALLAFGFSYRGEQVGSYISGRMRTRLSGLAVRVHMLRQSGR